MTASEGRETTASVAAFAGRAAAEAAMGRLRDAGFPADRVAILGKDHPPKRLDPSFDALVRAGRYVVIVRASQPLLTRAEGILRGLLEWTERGA